MYENDDSVMIKLKTKNKLELNISKYWSWRNIF